MSSDKRPLCRFHGKPGGCRRGSGCNFRHADGVDTSFNPSSNGPTSGPRRDSGSRPPVPRAPNGICDFYYNRGFCARGSDCRFRHEGPNQATQVMTQSSASYSSPDFSSFLTPAALARIQGAGTDGFFGAPVAELKPSEVNYHLRKFLEDSYRFRFALDVYGFVALMSNASSGNSSWVRVQSRRNNVALSQAVM